MEKSKMIYLFLLALRFILTLFPQTGYIHPDEYFQNPEIVYGDVFGLLSLRTWEFTVDNPIRSIVFPYFTVGIPALFMSTFGAHSLFGTKFFPYVLLVLPRLFMCFLSLLHDICLFRLTKMLGKNPYQALTIFASSYVTMVYLTRTFSNSLESICFTLLNYMVISEFIDLRRAVKLNDKIRDAILREHDKGYYAYGVLLSIGVFIRPTFLIYAMTPIIFWFLVCLTTENRMSKTAHFTVSVAGMSFLLAFIDTIYYNHDFDHFLSIRSIALSLENMIFTPINFVVYNINLEKLSIHGCHPWYLHFAANVPVMFSILGMYGLLHFAHILVLMAKRIDLNVSALELFMLLSFAAPVCFLSFIPHQEPRFLLPLICPLICLYGERLYIHCSRYKWIFAVWSFSNVMALAFFGFFHQGGLVSTLSYLHTAAAKNAPTGINVVFFHTYMPPRHLLAVEQSEKLVDLYDMQGASDEALLSKVQGLLKDSDRKKKLYIVSPSSLTIPVVNVNIVLSPNYKVKLDKKFFPHLTTEDLPVLYNIWNVAMSDASLFYKIRKLKDFFCLNVYRIDPLPVS